MHLRELGNTCVLGLQWGDEGKGKVVDLLVEHFDVAVRYGGGANAGHTVVVGGDTFALHLLPSGVLRPGVINVITAGVVIDPAALLGEIESLRQRGIAVGDNLRISDRAHLVMPYHRREDVLGERAARGADRIGTTGRGIGPCYADKAARRGLRVCDLYRPDCLREKLAALVAHKNACFAALYGVREVFDAGELADEYLHFGQQMQPFVCETAELLHDLQRSGRRLLYEGAQGCLLDIDHGTYPFVTSSSTIGFAHGAGVPARSVQSLVGVVKAYATRVGAGPFPTELQDARGEDIRQRGREFGTTTGRPRRCGWFDAVAAGYAARLAGPTHLAVMHLDTLSGLEELHVCIGYRRGAEVLRGLPADPQVLASVEPIYQALPGWGEDLNACRTPADLPANARQYLDFLAARLEAPVRIVGVGADRDQTIIVED